jgi:hypothetical protein
MQRTFYEFAGSNYAWSSDPKESKITIGTVSDVNSKAHIQAFPRVLIQRGASMCRVQFIADSLDVRRDGGPSKGGTDIHRQDVEGSINLIIEARNEGTCEEIAEFIRKFLVWSKPLIEKTFQFQSFGSIVQIGMCEMDLEDTEKFKISINVPYIVEDRWIRSTDLTRLNHIFRDLVPQAVT